MSLLRESRAGVVIAELAGGGGGGGGRYGPAFAGLGVWVGVEEGREGRGTLGGRRVGSHGCWKVFESRRPVSIQTWSLVAEWASSVFQ